jgi:uncharacterized membrane protein
VCVHICPAIARSRRNSRESVRGLSVRTIVLALLGLALLVFALVLILVVLALVLIVMVLALVMRAAGWVCMRRVLHRGGVCVYGRRG